MSNSYRSLFYSILCYIAPDVGLVDKTFILGVGHFRFVCRLIFNTLEGRSGIFRFLPLQSRVVFPHNIIIHGELAHSPLAQSLVSSTLYLQAINVIHIHSSVLIGPDVKVISANHDVNNLSKWLHAEPITIHENVWIGANSIILPGSLLSKNSVVGAGSVVKGTFPPNVIIAGVPAKIVKYL